MLSVDDLPALTASLMSSAAAAGWPSFLTTLLVSGILLFLCAKTRRIKPDFSKKNKELRQVSEARNPIDNAIAEAQQHRAEDAIEELIRRRDEDAFSGKR
ncbi:MAG: hypothetical protein MUP21_02060 [Dehalococcoidia bacterium]|nr:hypothetical protein [Dehalococcoidia bacterium]